MNLKEKLIIPFPNTPILQFAMVGSIMPQWKSQDIVIKALGSEKWKNRDWQLNIYGEGEYTDYIHALSIRHGIQSRVLLHGFEPNIEKIWQKNHILLIPSRQEAMPSALIEALVCGRPALASNVGSMAELITENFNGFIIEAPKEKFLLQGLERVWENRENLEKFGGNAHSHIMKIIIPKPEEYLFHYLNR